MHDYCREQWDVQHRSFLYLDLHENRFVGRDRHDAFRVRLQVIRQSRSGWQQQWLFDYGEAAIKWSHA
jgi:hypothetical protein